MAIRRRVYGGNSGYDGYSKSKRAIDVEQRGLCNKSQIDRNFAEKVSEIAGRKITVAQIKKDIANIPETEWHHTSSWGNKTSYYSAEDVAKYYKPAPAPKKVETPPVEIAAITKEREKARAKYEKIRPAIEKIRARIESENGLYFGAECQDGYAPNANQLYLFLDRGSTNIAHVRLDNYTEAKIEAWIKKVLRPYNDRAQKVKTLMQKYGITKFYFSPYTLRFECSADFIDKGGLYYGRGQNFEYQNFCYPLKFICWENVFPAIKLALQVSKKGGNADDVQNAIKKMKKVEPSYDD